jgi:hypothetical protein
MGWDGLSCKWQASFTGRYPPAVRRAIAWQARVEQPHLDAADKHGADELRRSVSHAPFIWAC